MGVRDIFESGITFGWANSKRYRRAALLISNCKRVCNFSVSARQRLSDPRHIHPDASPRVKSVELFKYAKCGALREIVRTLGCDKDAKGFRVSPNVAASLMAGDLSFIVTPLTYVADMGLKLGADDVFTPPCGADISQEKFTVNVARHRQSGAFGGSVVWEPRVLINAWLLQVQLKSNGASLSRAIIAAIRLTLPAPTASTVEDTIRSGDLNFPMPTSMKVIGSRLFALDILYQRTQIPITTSSRHLMPDSSPRARGIFLRHANSAWRILRHTPWQTSGQWNWEMCEISICSSSRLLGTDFQKWPISVWPCTISWQSRLAHGYHLTRCALRFTRLHPTRATSPTLCCRLCCTTPIRRAWMRRGL